MLDNDDDDETRLISTTCGVGDKKRKFIWILASIIITKLLYELSWSISNNLSLLQNPQELINVHHIMPYEKRDEQTFMRLFTTSSTPDSEMKCRAGIKKTKKIPVTEKAKPEYECTRYSTLNNLTLHLPLIHNARKANASPSSLHASITCDGGTITCIDIESPLSQQIGDIVENVLTVSTPCSLTLRTEVSYVIVQFIDSILGVAFGGAELHVTSSATLQAPQNTHEDWTPLKASSTQPSILIAIQDSLSRENFMRAMPYTKTWLHARWRQGNISVTNNTDYDDDHVAFVFNMYHGQEHNTPFNILPLLMGRYWSGNYESNRRRTKKFEPHSHSHPIKQFLPYILRQRGWMTMYGSPGPNIFVGTDHADGFTNSDVFSNQPHPSRSSRYIYTDMQKTKTHGIQEPCDLGAQPIQHMAEGVAQAWRAHRHIAKFAYVHDINFHVPMPIDSLRSADAPYLRLIRESLRADPNTIVFVMGDHGRKPSEYVPMMSMVVPKSFLKQNPQIAQNLEINQQRLLSAFDVYTVLKRLSSIDSGTTNPMPEPIYADNWSPKVKPIDFTNQIISSNRNCAEANIQSAWCLCSRWKRLKIPHTSHAIAALDWINSQFGIVKKFCPQLELDSIDFEEQNLSDQSQFVILFTVKQGFGERPQFRASVQQNKHKSILVTFVKHESMWRKYQSCVPAALSNQIRTDMCLCANNATFIT